MHIDRRTFITQSTLAGSGLFAGSIQSSLEKTFVPKASSPTKLKIFATNWGFQGTLTEFCKNAKDEGYDGVEIWVPNKEKDREVFFDGVEKYNLMYGFLAGNWGETYQQNMDSFRAQVERAASLKPVFVNCHSGKDYFSFEQNQKFIDYSTRMSKETGIPVYHETHRGRILFAPHIAKDYLLKIPELRLTLDISHWCCVAESLLGNQPEAVNLALSRTDHIHSRIGFEEGPQIPEPRAPEFTSAVDAHFAWWDKVVEHKMQRDELLTMTTEFGPANYMWTLPYTRQPVADLWDVNAHMMRLWRKRYQQ